MSDAKAMPLCHATELRGCAQREAGDTALCAPDSVLNPQSSLASLLRAPVRPGRVAWIGVRSGRRQPLLAREAVFAAKEAGLEGDHYQTRRAGKRQLTLIQAEHLTAIASYLGIGPVSPGLLRRNVVTEQINLLALKNKRFRIGSAVLEYTGECQPCSRMEELLGVGGYNAVRGHGGITARILCGGEIRLGDEITLLRSED